MAPFVLDRSSWIGGPWHQRRGAHLSKSNSVGFYPSGLIQKTRHAFGVNPAPLVPLHCGLQLWGAPPSIGSSIQPSGTPCCSHRAGLARGSNSEWILHWKKYTFAFFGINIFFLQNLVGTTKLTSKTSKRDWTTRTIHILGFQRVRLARDSPVFPCVAVTLC